MKLLLHIVVEWFADAVSYFMQFGRPKPVPSLLALNIDWFTNCSWVDQLLAFKQIDEFYYKK